MKSKHKYPTRKKLLRLTPCFSRVRSFGKPSISVDWSNCRNPFLDISDGNGVHLYGRYDVLNKLKKTLKKETKPNQGIFDIMEEMNSYDWSDENFDKDGSFIGYTGN